MYGSIKKKQKTMGKNRKINALGRSTRLPTVRLFDEDTVISFG